MNTLVTILIAIALFGVQISAQNCYLCSYVAGIIDDVCTPDNFDKDSLFVQQVECPNNGKCFTLYAEALGLETYQRSCTTYETPGAPTDPAAPAMVCGQGGVSCCDGDLCNDENVQVVDACYVCAYVAIDGEGVLDDDCTPANFDPSGDLSGKISCLGDNKCYAFGLEAGGVETYARGCTADEIPGVDLTCGQGGVQCCEGDLCNGQGFANEPSGNGNGDTSTLPSNGNDICYVCGYVKVEGVEVEDDCTPENFDPSGILVAKLPCPGEAKCFAFRVEESGIETFGRGCIADQIPGVTLTCGENGVQCCDGSLCNGGDFGTGTGISLTSMTITATCVLSFIGVMLFD